MQTQCLAHFKDDCAWNRKLSNSVFSVIGETKVYGRRFPFFHVHIFFFLTCNTYVLLDKAEIFFRGQISRIKVPYDHLAM